MYAIAIAIALSDIDLPADRPAAADNVDLSDTETIMQREPFKANDEVLFAGHQWLIQGIEGEIAYIKRGGYEGEIYDSANLEDLIPVKNLNTDDAE